jgi:hypothetical protein
MAINQMSSGCILEFKRRRLQHVESPSCEGKQPLIAIAKNFMTFISESWDMTLKQNGNRMMQIEGKGREEEVMPAILTDEEQTVHTHLLLLYIPYYMYSIHPQVMT